MAVRLSLLFFVFATALAVEWYATREIDEETKGALIEKGCFRGSYGIREDLHLFTCLTKDLNLEPFAILADSTRLCVIETRDSQRVKIKLNEHQDLVSIFYENQDDIVIGKAKVDDEVPLLCSRSEFEGAAWNAIPVPSQPMSPPHPVKDFKTDAPIQSITYLVGNVSEQNLRSNVQRLQDFHTRLSTSTQANESVAWAVSEFQRFGFNVTRQNFRSGYCPNIIAVKQGTASSIVLVGSHIDSRAASLTNVSARAPGADDNGSGTASNLELARLIHNQNIRLTSTLVLATFCGEEQGLYGSNYMADEYKRQNANIIGMYNADMIGYRCGSSSTLTFDSRGVSSSLTNTCKGIVPDYVSGFPIGDNSGCCSDNQGFQNAGYATVSFFECPGSTVANPNYHRENDTIATINFPQLVYFSKALYACALTQARPL